MTVNTGLTVSAFRVILASALTFVIYAFLALQAVRLTTTEKITILT